MSTPTEYNARNGEKYGVLISDEERKREPGMMDRDMLVVGGRI